MYGRALVGLASFAGLQAFGDLVLWNWLGGELFADPIVSGTFWLAWTGLQFVVAALIGVLVIRAGLDGVRCDAAATRNSATDAAPSGLDQLRLAST